MNAESVAAAVTALAVALSEGRSEDELELMAAVLTQIADTLATIATVRGQCGD